MMNAQAISNEFGLLKPIFPLLCSSAVINSFNYWTIYIFTLTINFIIIKFFASEKAMRPDVGCTTLSDYVK